MIDNCFRKVNEEGIIREFCGVALTATRQTLRWGRNILTGLGWRDEGLRNSNIFLIFAANNKQNEMNNI